MREVARAEAFVAAPVGTSIASGHWLAWCYDPSFMGVSFWGRPGVAAARALIQVWDYGALPGVALPYDGVTDGRDLELIDPSVFEVVAEDLQRNMARFDLFRRHAVVRGGGLAASVMAGLLPILGASHDWRLFDDVASAFEWVGRSDALAEVEATRDAARRRAAFLHTLREQLWAQPGSTLEQAARALRTSPRSLQRQLRALGTDFSGEQGDVRLMLARTLLSEDDAKLEAVADRLGFASASHFTTAFKRLTGMTPSDARARYRGR